MTDSEKIEEILKLCRGMADQLVEHDVKLKFIEAQSEVHSDDQTALGVAVRSIEAKLGELKSDLLEMKLDVHEVKVAVGQLTAIAEGHDARLREDRKSIHDLQAEEEKRRVAGGGNSASG